MEDTNATLAQLLADPSAAPSPEWVEAMRRAHPAWTLPGALLLQRGAAAIDAAAREELQMRLALCSPDRAALVEMADIDGDGWAAMFPPAAPPEAPSTESAIDTFLNAYGSGDPRETAMLEQMIFNPVPADFFSEEELAASGGETGDSGESGAGIPLLPPELAQKRSERSEPSESSESSEHSEASSQAKADKPERTEPATADSSLLSESLAKIFIKQRRYERAYEIISDLNLKFPEKSVYFADQLRFLRKLILIQRQQSRD